jgi:hypothetical protein
MIEARMVETAPGMVFDVSIAGREDAPLVFMLHGFGAVLAAFRARWCDWFPRCDSTIGCHAQGCPEGGRLPTGTTAEIGGKTGEAMAQHVWCDVGRQVTQLGGAQPLLPIADDRCLAGSTGEHQITDPRLVADHCSGQFDKKRTDAPALVSASRAVRRDRSRLAAFTGIRPSSGRLYRAIRPRSEISEDFILGDLPTCQ